MRSLLNLLLTTIVTIVAYGQSAPVINSFSPVSTYPLDTIIVTGSGFSSTPANLQVWFGPVTGTIISSTDNLIEVVVPPSATVANLEVKNLSTQKGTRSNLKFTPYYSGTPFDPTKFGAPLTFTNAAELYDMCSCDFNSDGKADVASSKVKNAGDVLILKNQSTFGALSFTQQTANIGFPTEQIACGDLNADGKPDLVATRTGNPNHTVFFLTNTSSAGNISFSAPGSLFLDPTHYARYVFIRDLNLDGKPEIVVSNSFNAELYIFVNTSSGGNPTFDPTPIRITVAGASFLYGMDVQDMNGDSKPEIILTQFNTSNIYILINESTNLIEFNPTPFVQNTSAVFLKIVAADFNEDGKMDIASSTFLGGTLDVWFNTPQIGVIQFTKVSTPTASFPNGFDVSDIDGDKDLDIVVGCQDQISVLLNDGNNAGPNFSRVDIAKPNINRNVLLVDFDGDGKPDISHVNRSSSNQFSISFLNNLNCFKPEILNEAPLSICVGQTIQLRTIPALNTNHDWKLAGGSFKSSTDYFADITSAGSYTVTSSSGACDVTSSAFVVTADAGATVPTEPQITSNQPLCTGQTLTLNTPSVSGATYTWTKPDGSTVTTQSISIPNSTVSMAGEYSLVVTVGVCRSNKGTELVDITNLQNFDIYSPSETNSACQGSSISLTVTDYPNFTYQWMKDGVAQAGQTATTFSASASGKCKNRVTHSTIVGCTIDTKELDVKILTPPTASFTPESPACINVDLNFVSTSTIDPLATAICSWDFGDGTLSSNCAETHQYTTAQSFPVILSISYDGVTGCASISNQSLVVSDAAQPIITPSLTEICPGEETDLTVSGGTFTNFDWTPSGTGNPLTVTEGGDYTVTTTDANGCLAIANVTITDKPTPTVVIDPPAATVASGQTIQLTASGAETYIWSPAELLDSPTIPNPMATPFSTTTFTVIGSTAGQCDVEKTVVITVDGEIKIPNVFTPNGDGNNDTWKIPGYETTSNCLVIIFDRDGSKVVEGYANNLLWDGTYNNKPAPQGTYYYIISCPDAKPVTGNILVAR